MTRWLSALVLGLFACLSSLCAASDEQANNYQINISAPQYADGSVVGINRSLMSDGTVQTQSIHQGKLQGGVISFAGRADEPYLVMLAVMDTSNGLYAYAQIVIEPGTTEIKVANGKHRMDRRVSVSGGKYAQALKQGLKTEACYQSFREKELALFNSGADIFDQADGAAKWNDVRRLGKECESDYFHRLFSSSGDPYMKLLSLQMGAVSDVQQRLKEMLKLESFLANSNVYAESVAVVRRAVERQDMLSSLSVGKNYKDFDLPSLSGDTVVLSDVLSNSKYVLVEFWASWCSPCRAEIPNLKAAYDKYQAQGFEIVSVTLDEDRDEWEEASDEEQLPWHNVGDLMARSSPVVKKYGVSGVPDSFLINSETGKIEALHLRGMKLQQKLAELFSNPT